MNTQEKINQARSLVETDPGLAAFIVRDCPEAKELELDSLLWLLSDSRNNPHKNDVIPLLDQLGEFVK